MPSIQRNLVSFLICESLSDVFENGIKDLNLFQSKRKKISSATPKNHHKEITGSLLQVSRFSCGEKAGLGLLLHY